jgi:CRP-like cAMP-binding protein
MSFFDMPGAGVDAVLHNYVFLEGATEKEWRTIFKFAEMRSFGAREILVRQGDQDHSFYILTQGIADVLTSAGDILATMPEGSVFGEVAFFDGRPRSQTVRSTTAGSAARITRSTFETLAAWEPVLARRILIELGRVLALRLRTADLRFIK